MRDLYNSLAALPALVAAVHAAAAAGTIIDLKGSKGVVFMVGTGAVAGDGDFGLTIQESDTNVTGDFANAAADVIQSDADDTLEASSAYRLGYVGHKRYVRLSLTKAGGTSIAAAAVAVLRPLDRPAS